MKIEVNSRELESFVAVAPDEKRGGVVLTCRCAISRTFWQVSLAPEEALVVGLAISQVAVKGLDQRAVCQVYERAMGRVMWAAMEGAGADMEVPENLVMFPGMKSVPESTPPAPPVAAPQANAGGITAGTAVPHSLDGPL